MKTAVIVDSVRTGLAKSHRGGFNITRADDMLAHIINNLMERNPNLPGSGRKRTGKEARTDCGF